MKGFEENPKIRRRIDLKELSEAWKENASWPSRRLAKKKRCRQKIDHTHDSMLADDLPFNQTVMAR